MYFFKRCWAEIDLDNVAHNYNYFASFSKESKVIAVIKANAYGHGANEIALRLMGEGCDYFAVSNVIEGVNLRKEGVRGQILILGYTNFSTQEIDLLLKYDIIQTIHSFEYASHLNMLAHSKVKCCLILDSGMGRLGFDSSSQSDLDCCVESAKLPNIDIVGAFTHLSVADDFCQHNVNYTKQQIASFEQAIDYIKSKGICIPFVHCHNSAGMFYHNQKTFNASRLGIALYGLYPTNSIEKDMNIRPVMTLKTVIASVKNVEKGKSISYGRTYTTTAQTKIATVTVGYADGYPRCLSNKGSMTVCGKRAAVVGRVTMDQLMLDVSNIDCKMGDIVTIFGKGGCSAEKVAQDANTINYEITSLIAARVPRVFYQGGKIVSVREHTY